MAYKEFGATIAPANTSETGFPIAIGSHIGGGRTIDDKSNLKLWQLLGEGTDLTEQKDNAIGQIWYDRSDGKYYKLTGFTGDTPNWVEYLDTSNIDGTTNYVTKFTDTNSIGDSLIYDDGTNIGIGTTTPSEKLEVDGNINLKGNQIKNVAIEVVTSSLPTTNNFVGRQVTYEGRSYIWDGSAWKCDSDYLEIGGRNLLLNTKELNGFTYGTTDKYLDFNICRTIRGTSGSLDTFRTTTIAPPEGNTHVVSFYAKSSVPTPIHCHWYSPNTTTSAVNSDGHTGTAPDGLSILNITTEWKRYWIVWTQTSTNIVKTVIIGRNKAVEGAILEIAGVKLEKGNKATDWTPAPEDKADESREINYTSSPTQLTNEQTHLLSVVLNTYGGNIAKLFSDLEALGIKDKKEYQITGSSGTILVSTHNITTPSVVAFYKNGKPIELDYTIASNGDISWESSVSFLSNSGVKVVIIG